MHESDLHAEETGARDVVDHVHTLSRQVGESTWQIVDGVGDVVHPGAAPGEEPAHRSVLSQWREQLDAALTQPNGRRLDALRLERVTALDLGSEQPPVRVDRLVEVLDGDSEMVNPLRLHAKRMLSAAGRSPVGDDLDA